MLALCVDDETLLLSALVRAVESCPEIEETASFTLCSKAIEWAKEHRPDVAFLDVRMRGMSGIELAEKLLEIHPDLPVIFCTGYREYAFDAIQLHAAGYIMKPIRKEDVQREINAIQRKPATSDKLLTAQCFGNFEVFAGGAPLRFKRTRSKELLAFLIDRRGAAVTAKEICAALWEDDEIGKNIMHFYKLLADLRETLTAVGAQDVLIKGSRDYAVDAAKIDCDFYRYIMGDREAEKLFCGEYMLQYPWGEYTAATLEDARNRD